MSKKLEFPEGFLWGAGTSSFQVEADVENSWSMWCEQNAQRLAHESENKFGHLSSWKFIKEDAQDPQNYIPGKCADFQNLFEKDLDIAKELGHNAHRFSIEWARVEREKGVFDEEALEYYRELTRAIKARGMEPMITLWWWANPLWVEKKGGWENKEVIGDFVAYVEKVVEVLGKEGIIFWQPLNEPGVPVGMGYVKGEHPPQVKNLLRANKVFKNLMKGYKRAYGIIHQNVPDAKVGISHYARHMMPYKNRWWNKIAVSILDYIRNWRFLDTLAENLDFIGIQYYRTNIIRLNFLQKGYLGFIDEIDDFTQTTDMGWSMYPEGMYHILKRAAQYRKDIYISENGIADAKDQYRVWWIRENLKELHRTMEEGVPVKGYFHWSLIDIFEWDKGFWPRFGLVEVDFKTQKRKIRPSAHEYAKICKENALEVEE